MPADRRNVDRGRRLDLVAIEYSLRAVQADFERINNTLSVAREPLTDQVIDHLMLGYRRVDALVAARRNPFALGSSPELLELNLLTLCGSDDRTREGCQRLRSATEAHYYDTGENGIAALAARMRSMQGESVWRRAAMAYMFILSQPQLFLEGNHRTGCLVMSWMLAREGEAPFVLSVENARAYFDPSTLVKHTRKHTLKMMVEKPLLVKRLGQLLRSEADTVHMGG
ncbi:hypothetical protein F2Q65_08640 [Thiohalocapsa marina]|uniref:Fido domain-containing protein n=2 Tax=Thiohalocapsa marina TaxID=424902 RepID=A0A5M8FLB3_9GAMM|nr:hypothetical protein F2Q65_08640 [Thiohalocapsa marina]